MRPRDTWTARLSLSTSLSLKARLRPSRVRAAFNAARGSKWRSSACAGRDCLTTRTIFCLRLVRRRRPPIRSESVRRLWLFRGDAHTQTLARLKTIYTGIAPQTHEATPHASDIRPTRCSLANYSMLGCLGLELSAIVCHHSQWPLLHTYIDRLRIRAHVQMRVAIGMA